MSSEQKKSAFLDVILFGLAVFFIYLAFYAYYCEIQPQTYNVTQRLYSTSMNVTTWEHSYNFTSYVFSAQSEIEITAMAHLTDEYKKKYPDYQKPAVLYVGFPDAMGMNSTFEHGHVLHEKIALYDPDDDGYYTGSSIKVVYQSEGDKCIILQETQDDFTKPCQDEDSKPAIHISSADSYYQMQTNKTATALGWVFVAFAVISAKGFLKGLTNSTSFILGLARNDNSNNKKNDEKTNKNQSKDQK